MEIKKNVLKSDFEILRETCHCWGISTKELLNQHEMETEDEWRKMNIRMTQLIIVAILRTRKKKENLELKPNTKNKRMEMEILRKNIEVIKTQKRMLEERMREMEQDLRRKEMDFKKDVEKRKQAERKRKPEPVVQKEELKQDEIQEKKDSRHKRRRSAVLQKYDPEGKLERMISGNENLDTVWKSTGHAKKECSQLFRLLDPVITDFATEKRREPVIRDEEGFSDLVKSLLRKIDDVNFEILENGEIDVNFEGNDVRNIMYTRGIVVFLRTYFTYKWMWPNIPLPAITNRRICCDGFSKFVHYILSKYVFKSQENVKFVFGFTRAGFHKNILSTRKYNETHLKSKSLSKRKYYRGFIEEVSESFHAWNVVKLHKWWWCVDTTWCWGPVIKRKGGGGNDDTDPLDEFNGSFFMLTPEEIQSTHFALYRLPKIDDYRVKSIFEMITNTNEEPISFKDRLDDFFEKPKLYPWAKRLGIKLGSCNKFEVTVGKEKVNVTFTCGKYPLMIKARIYSFPDDSLTNEKKEKVCNCVVDPKVTIISGACTVVVETPPGKTIELKRVYILRIIGSVVRASSCLGQRKPKQHGKKLDTYVEEYLSIGKVIADFKLKFDENFGSSCVQDSQFPTCDVSDENEDIIWDVDDQYL